MQEHLKVAYTKKALELFAPIPTRKAAAAEETDFTDIAALVVTEEDESIIHDRRVKAFHIPLFLIVHGHEERTDNTLGHVYGMIDTRSLSRPYFERQIEQAASSYEDSLLPPFFKTLKSQVGIGIDNLFLSNLINHTQTIKTFAFFNLMQIERFASFNNFFLSRDGRQEEKT